MKIFAALTSFAVVAGSIPAASAQEFSGPLFEVGYAEVNDVSGGEIGLGYRFSNGTFTASAALGGFIYEGSNDRYYHDSRVNRCRDSTNGQFAKSEKCSSSDISAYARLELLAAVSNFEFGAGVRIGEDDPLPYATASYEFSQNTAFKVVGGQDYLGAGFVIKR